MTYVLRNGKVGLSVPLSSENFEQNKQELLTIMQNAGVNDARVKDFINDVKNGADLERTRHIFNLISQGRYDPPNPDNPPLGSVVKLPDTENSKNKYQNVREGINDLYRRVALGDQEADRQLKALWQKAINTLKKDYGKMQFSGSGCPKCGSFITEGSDICPACNFDIAKFKREGGEFQ